MDYRNVINVTCRVSISEALMVAFISEMLYMHVQVYHKHQLCVSAVA